MKIQIRDVASVAIAAGAIVLVIFIISRQASSNDRLRENYDALHSQYSQLYLDAIDAGATPTTLEPDEVVEVDRSLIPIPDLMPSATPGPPGEKGDRGPGPTEAQVRAAVREYCDQDEACDPTDAQIEAAVTAYCAEDACTGDDGVDGSSGRDGTTGGQGPPGADGEDATDAQVDAAVARYCTAQPGGSCVGADGTDGSDGAKGEKGDPGPTGPAGPAGPAGQFQPGDAHCPPGEYISRFTVQPNGDWSAICQ